MNDKTMFRTVLTGIISATLFGLAAGAFRYWLGYFILGQAVVIGLGLPWLMGKLTPAHMIPKRDSTAGLIFCLFACFLLAQAAGFGISQPWFDVSGWLKRVFSGETSEFIFGIAMHGGVENQAFSMGVKGWGWVAANIFDLAFMYFFLIVGVNTYFEKAEERHA